MLANAPARATVPAEDIRRAVTFYTEVLGLKKLDGPPEGAALFQAGEGSQIFMYQRARTKAEHTAITFIVSDVEATVKNLIAKGVTMEQYDMEGLKPGTTEKWSIKTNALGIADQGNMKMAWLKDTEGNILGITTK